MMKKIRTAMRAVVACILMTVPLAACDGASGANTETGKVLTIGVTTALPSFDPTKNGNGPMTVLFSLPYEPLIHLREDGKLGPGLAKSWRYVGTGNMTFELELRPDAKFSDGTAVTAATVKTWLDYFAGAQAALATAMGPVRSVEAIGQWTVRIHLAEPNPMVAYALTEGFNWGLVASPKAVAAPASLGNQPAGAGPYQLDASQTVANDHYTFVPNPYYFARSEVRYTKIVVRIITSQNTMLQAIKSGQIDIAQGDVTTADAATAAGINVLHAMWETDGITFLDRSGTLSKPLADVRVRQAMNYAIDRKAITDALMGKYGKPTSQMQTVDGYDPAYENYYPYDPAKARRLLAEAGYARGFTFTVVDLAAGVAGNTGEPLTQAIAKYLSEVGIKLDIQTSATGADWFRKVLSGSYPAFTWTRGGDPMWLFWGVALKRGAVLNQHGWQDPKLDSLRDAGARAQAANASTQWKEMSRRIVTQADFLPVFQFSRFWYVNDKVGGFSIISNYPATPSPTTWYPK
jgi:peptide/nickel transport system substrate-binding protein